MIADFLSALFRANLAGGAAILLILVLRRPVRRLFGAQAAYRLWGLAILASLAVLLPARTEPAPPPAAAPTLAGPTLAAPIPAQAGVAARSPHRPGSVATAANPTTPSTAEWLFAAWLAGVAASAGLVAWRQWRFLAALGRLEDADCGVVIAERSGVGPAVVGVFAPRVIVPADFHRCFTPEEQTVVLAHERAHLTRQDARANGLLALVQCLCWFNPLTHVAARLVRLDQELACDAEVVARYPAARRRYAEALLKTQIAATPLPLGCYWPARVPHPLEDRIALLKAPTPGAFRRSLGLTVTLAIGLAGGVAAWASQPAELVVARTAPWSVAPTRHIPAPTRLTSTTQSPAPAAATAADGTGDWVGAIKSPDLRIGFHIKGDAKGYAGVLDSPDQGVYDLPLDHVTLAGDALSLDVPKIKATYQAHWDPAARQWVGTWAQAGSTWPLALSRGVYPPGTTVAGLDGGWDTQLTGGAGPVRLGFNIHTDAHGTRGTLDSPDQNAYGLPLSTITRDGDAVTLSFKISDITVSGNLSADGKTLTGVFKQFGSNVPVVLTRRAPGAAAPYPPAHPPAQAAKPPVVDVDAAVLSTYAGAYRFAPGLEMAVTVEDGRLFAQITNQGKIQIFASSPTDFFWKQVDAQVSFAAPIDGHSPYVVLHQGATYMLGRRAS